MSLSPFLIHQENAGLFLRPSRSRRSSAVHDLQLARNVARQEHACPAPTDTGSFCSGPEDLGNGVEDECREDKQRETNEVSATGERERGTQEGPRGASAALRDNRKGSPRGQDGPDIPEDPGSPSGSDNENDSMTPNGDGLERLAAFHLPRTLVGPSVPVSGLLLHRVYHLKLSLATSNGRRDKPVICRLPVVCMRSQVTRRLIRAAVQKARRVIAEMRSLQGSDEGTREAFLQRACLPAERALDMARATLEEAYEQERDPNVEEPEDISEPGRMRIDRPSPR